MISLASAAEEESLEFETASRVRLELSAAEWAMFTPDT
jgi:hypothetical protein